MDHKVSEGLVMGRSGIPLRRLSFHSERVWTAKCRRVGSWVGVVYRSDGCLFTPSVVGLSSVGAKSQPG